MAEPNEDSELTQSMKEALHLRSDFLKGQADSLTLPEVRRLLERDLSLKTFELDSQKGVVKRLVDEVLNGNEDVQDVKRHRKRSKKNPRVVDDGDSEDEKHVKNGGDVESLADNGLVEEVAVGDEKSEKSSDAVEALEDGDESEAKVLANVHVDENLIREALRKRADDLRSQIESMTVTQVRRLLEKDMGLETNKLDEHKVCVRNLVHELLDDANEEAKPSDGEKDKVVKARKNSKEVQAKSKKAQKGIDNDEDEDVSSGSGDLEGSKPPKILKKKNDSEVKKTEKRTTEPKKSFGPEVERLRALCRTLELGIPPSAYAKAKQAPLAEREKVLVGELEQVLGRVGCPPNPSAQDMRRVKMQLKKKRDLDGIDHTNIVSEPRRSRTSTFSWFTPRPTNKYLQMKENDEKSSDVEDSDDEGK